MRRYAMFRFAALSLSLFALFLNGCESENKGAAAPATSPITTASSSNNIQAKIIGVTINSPPVVTFALSDETGQPITDIADWKASGGSINFVIARISADGSKYENYIGNSSKQPVSDSTGTFTKVSDGIFTYQFATDIKDTTKTLNGLVFDPTLTHTVGAQIQKTISVNGKRFQQAVNPYLSFRPDGGTIATTREIVSTSACLDCHGKLLFHGGGRREIAFCILCHVAGATDPDTGNSIEFKSLIHKIHYGKKLPSFVTGKASFAIIGFRNSFNSYSTVTYPLMSGDGLVNNTPVNCDKCHRTGTDTFGQAFGKDAGRFKTVITRSACGTCHDMTTFDGTTALTLNTAVKPPAGATGPFTPSTLTTNVAVPHTGGIQADDSNCATAACHAPATPADFDGLSVTGAHTIFEKSSRFPGLNLKINSVQLKTVTVNGIDYIQPIVNFSAFDNKGNPVNPLTFSSPATTDIASFNLKLGFMINGNYVNAGINDGTLATVGGLANQSWSKVAQPVTMPLNSTNPANVYNPAQAGSAAVKQADGSYTVTYATILKAAPLPSFATLLRKDVVQAAVATLDPVTGLPVKVTGVIGIEGTYTFFSTALNAHHNTTARSSIRAGAKSDQFYFDLSGVNDLSGTPVGAARLSNVRRSTVDQAKCEVCHSRLNLHGGNRTDVLECVICHNPSFTDKGDRTPASLPWADGLTEQTGDLKVFIHRVHMGKRLANIYILGAKGNVFSNDGFPNDMIRCNVCHIQDNPFDSFDTSTFNGSRVVAPSVAPAGTDLSGAYDPTSADFTSGRLTPFQATCTSCHNGTSGTIAGASGGPVGHAAANTNGVTELCSNCHNAGFITSGHQPPN